MSKATLLTHGKQKPKVHVKFKRACGPPEARQLRVRQRLGQLEDARHVLAEVGQLIVVEAASADQSSAEG